MKITKWILILLCVPLLASADVYMKKDADGSISYSDQPQPDADKVILQPVNTLGTEADKPAVPEPQNPEQINPEAPQPEKEADKYAVQEERKPYKSVAISSPQDQETLQNPVTIEVKGSSEPQLQKKFNDKYALYINGTQFGEASETASFSIPREAVPRGTYTLQIAILDDKNQALITSSMITVYVKYRTIAI